AEPPCLLNVSRHALVPHPYRSCAVPLALLQGEMTLFILRATPTPTGSVPAQLALPCGERALALCRGASDGGCAPRGRGRRLAIPGHLCHKPAARRIGLGQLLLLRFGQLPAQIFDGTAQFNKDMIG